MRLGHPASYKSYALFVSSFYISVLSVTSVSKQFQKLSYSCPIRVPEWRSRPRKFTPDILIGGE